MEIVFLGTTAAVPSAARGHSAIALKYHDEVILFDCGEGTQRQLITSRTSYMKIKKIFITHFHGDHVLGLPGLIQTLSFAGRQEDLSIYGPKGIRKVFGSAIGLGEYDACFKINVREISKLKEDRYIIRSVKVNHNVPTYGLIFEETKGREFLVEKARKLGIKPGPAYSKLHSGRKVMIDGKWIHPDDVLGEKKEGIKIVYSSDTRPVKSIYSNCKNAVLIHDSTFDESLQRNAVETKHSTCTEAALVAKRGGAKSLFLTHISPRYKNDAMLVEQARKEFGNTIAARDLMAVKL